MLNKEYSFATTNDLQEITNLFKNTIQNVALKDYSAQEITSWSEGAKNTDNWLKRIDTHYFLLVKIEDVLVGMGSLDSNGYLDVIYVHHDYQGHGIASDLLRRMEEKAKSDGHRFITSDVSITAKPFFLHKGYTLVKPQLVLCRGVVLRNYHVQKQLV
ncbi:MAG: GNAT family N-acetyltransferase [Saprospiraceae bacterium]|nr:GNAT family N-acetyltransferase [Saprospiraceae bacterium]